MPPVRVQPGYVMRQDLQEMSERGEDSYPKTL